MATSPSESLSIPKAILYYNPASVWSSAALLALEEKGYGSDELESKIVDLRSGENFAPAFLRINPNGTIPALVVPLKKTLGAGVPHKYRALTDTKSVLEFLDKSRSTISRTHTTSSAPAPTLTPATIALSDLYHNIVTLIHSVSVNFLGVAATTHEELLKKAQSPRAEAIHNRQAVLRKHLAEEGESVIKDVKQLWDSRSTENGLTVRVFDAAGKSESELSGEEKQDREAFFKKSVETWSGIKRILTRLEKDLIGPYALGDQFSLADLHVGVWITRILFICGAPKPSPQGTPKAGDGSQLQYLGFSKVEEVVHEHTGDIAFKLGPKVCAFWDALRERESWKKVYVDGLH